MPVQTRQVLDSDFEWLLRLRLATMSEHFDASGYTPSAEEHSNRLRQQYSAIRIIQIDGCDVGMVKVLRGSDVWHLIQIQITPERQSRGLGTAVIEAILAEGRGAKVPISLHVLKVNPARHLYERLGFKVVEDLGHSYEMRSDA